MYTAASKHLTPVTLELGGKNPVFVTKSCDLKSTVKRLIWSKYLNAGQQCTAPDYVLVHQSLKKEFLELAKREIEQSQFSIDNDNYVQIITEKHTERLVNMLDDEKIYCGGKYNISDRFIAPTIMDNVTFDDAVMQEEIFGPILPVIEYDKIEDAIAKVKLYPHPLSCYIFTKDKKIKTKLLSEISFGNGAVNEATMQISNKNLPFGGVGTSGIGSFHGEFGFRAFSHYKAILDKPTWFEANLKYYPHTLKKMKWIQRLMGQK